MEAIRGAYPRRLPGCGQLMSGPACEAPPERDTAGSGELLSNCSPEVISDAIWRSQVLLSNEARPPHDSRTGEAPREG